MRIASYLYNFQLGVCMLFDLNSSILNIYPFCFLFLVHILFKEISPFFVLLYLIRCVLLSILYSFHLGICMPFDLNESIFD